MTAQELAEVFDAEAEAAFHGLTAAVQLHQAQLARQIHVLLDNLEVVKQLQEATPCIGSSQATFHAFQNTIKAWKERPRNAFPNWGKILVHWIPGHAGIPGNEVADHEAKQGCQAEPPGVPKPCTFATARKICKQNLYANLTKHWENNAPARYKELKIGITKRPKELSLPRTTLGSLLAARSGHGDFAAYHERFNHPDAVRHCKCGLEKAPTHFYYCREGRKAAKHPSGSRTAADILSTNEGAQLFAEWLQRSAFYTQICKQH